MPDLTIVGRSHGFSSGQNVPVSQDDFLNHRRIKRLDVYLTGSQTAGAGGPLVATGPDCPLSLIKSIRVKRGGTTWIEMFPQSAYRYAQSKYQKLDQRTAPVALAGATGTFFSRFSIPLENAGPRRDPLISGWDTYLEGNITTEIEWDTAINAFGADATTTAANVYINAIADSNADQFSAAQVAKFSMFQPMLIEQEFNLNAAQRSYPWNLTNGGYLSDMQVIMLDKNLLAQAQYVNGLSRRFGLTMAGNKAIIGSDARWADLVYGGYMDYHVPAAEETAGMAFLNFERTGKGPFEWLPAFGNNSNLVGIFDTLSTVDPQFTAVTPDSGTFARVLVCKQVPNAAAKEVLRKQGLAA